ncbi:unnamed protein product [Amoebophrya sp. A25]|nr:unnamed protein product [Amoebophrya sp. A25]|eukprot:GSA25T00015248001.1
MKSFFGKIFECLRMKRLFQLGFSGVKLCFVVVCPALVLYSLTKWREQGCHPHPFVSELQYGPTKIVAETLLKLSGRCFALLSAVDAVVYLRRLFRISSSTSGKTSEVVGKSAIQEGQQQHQQEIINSSSLLGSADFDEEKGARGVEEIATEDRCCSETTSSGSSKFSRWWLLTKRFLVACANLCGLAGAIVGMVQGNMLSDIADVPWAHKLQKHVHLTTWFFGIGAVWCTLQAARDVCALLASFRSFLFRHKGAVIGKACLFLWALLAYVILQRNLDFVHNCTSYHGNGIRIAQKGIMKNFRSGCVLPLLVGCEPLRKMAIAQYHIIWSFWALTLASHVKVEGETQEQEPDDPWSVLASGLSWLKNLRLRTAARAAKLKES